MSPQLVNRELLKLSGVFNFLHPNFLKMINPFLTALIPLEIEEQAWSIGNPGSGTLVQIGPYRGILTGRHVVEQIIDSREILGLFVKAGVLNKNFVKTDDLTVIRLGENTGEKIPENPDLAFVILPLKHVFDLISMGKEFYNLDAARNKIFPNIGDYLESAKDEDEVVEWIWVSSGMRNETRKESQEPNFMAPVPSWEYTQDFCSSCSSIRMGENGHDCIEFELDCSGSLYRKNCSGMSGGPVWQVKAHVHYKSDEMVDCTVEDFVLGGVICESENNVGGKILLKCHGHKSVYEHLYNEVKKRV
jgi:hypothetical protein